MVKKGSEISTPHYKTIMEPFGSSEIKSNAFKKK